MKGKVKKETSYVPVVIIIISIVLMGVAEGVEHFPLQTKIGFIGKVGIVVGVIGFWLFTVLPRLGK